MIDPVALLIFDWLLDLDALPAQAGKLDLIADLGADLIQGSFKIQSPVGRHIAVSLRNETK
ncbi:MAG: hypothetical protein WBG92_06630 [Thiohalocapsa sp.]